MAAPQGPADWEGRGSLGGTPGRPEDGAPSTLPRLRTAARWAQGPVWPGGDGVRPGGDGVWRLHTMAASSHEERNAPRGQPRAPRGCHRSSRLLCRWLLSSASFLPSFLCSWALRAGSSDRSWVPLPASRTPLRLSLWRAWARALSPQPWIWGGCTVRARRAISPCHLDLTAPSRAPTLPSAPRTQGGLGSLANLPAAASPASPPRPWPRRDRITSGRWWTRQYRRPQCGQSWPRVTMLAVHLEKPQVLSALTAAETRASKSSGTAGPG